GFHGRSASIVRPLGRKSRSRPGSSGRPALRPRRATVRRPPAAAGLPPVLGGARHLPGRLPGHAAGAAVDRGPHAAGGPVRGRAAGGGRDRTVLPRRLARRRLGRPLPPPPDADRRRFGSGGALAPHPHRLSLRPAEHGPALGRRAAGGNAGGLRQCRLRLVPPLPRPARGPRRGQRQAGGEPLHGPDRGAGDRWHPDRRRRRADRPRRRRRLVPRLRPPARPNPHAGGPAPPPHREADPGRDRRRDRRGAPAPRAPTVDPERDDDRVLRLRLLRRLRPLLHARARADGDGGRARLRNRRGRRLDRRRDRGADRAPPRAGADRRRRPTPVRRQRDGDPAGGRLPGDRPRDGGRFGVSPVADDHRRQCERPRPAAGADAGPAPRPGQRDVPLPRRRVAAARLPPWRTPRRGDRAHGDAGGRGAWDAARRGLAVRLAVTAAAPPPAL
ncbi:MAG: hypothetical protein AVDCRST_MAG19-3689, partial [uncultured Thermomicrobiales bacterium]